MAKVKHIRILKKANYYAGWPSEKFIPVLDEVAKRLIEEGYAEPKPRTRKKKDE